MTQGRDRRTGEDLWEEDRRAELHAKHLAEQAEEDLKARTFKDNWFDIVPTPVDTPRTACGG
jgi:hypothetical protein